MTQLTRNEIISIMTYLEMFLMSMDDDEDACKPVRKLINKLIKMRDEK